VISLGDILLAGGVGVNLPSLHGEPVEVLTGADAGKTFTAIIENEQDISIDTNLGIDPRMKRIARFHGAAPNLSPINKLKLADGTICTAVRQPGAAYLSTDFELVEFSADHDE
jgi:hypothetical protein